MRKVYDCQECGAHSVSATKVHVDAKTAGPRGQTFSRRILPPKFGWPLIGAMNVGWAVLFILVALSYESFGVTSVVALLIGAFVPMVQLREYRRWKRAEPVPGTLYGCSACKHWWTVVEGSDPDTADRRGEQAISG